MSHSYKLQVIMQVPTIVIRLLIAMLVNSSGNSAQTVLYLFRKVLRETSMVVSYSVSCVRELEQRRRSASGSQ